MLIALLYLLHQRFPIIVRWICAQAGFTGQESAQKTAAGALTSLEQVHFGGHLGRYGQHLPTGGAEDLALLITHVALG